MNESFGKNEKLKSRKLISQVFTEGKSITSFPLKLVYLRLPESGNHQGPDKTSLILAGVSVPKRNFRKAVQRIHLKRLMREAYRKNKYLVYERNPKPYAFMFLYLGKEKMDYHKITNTMQGLLQRLVKKEFQ